MNIFQRRCGPWLAVVAATAAFACPVSAGEFKVRAQLAWGTDDMKPNDPALHELDPKIRDKFRHLRWKNYFVVKTADTASSPKVCRLELSAQCAVELQEVGGQVVVRIFSLKPGAEPKLAATKTVDLGELRKGHIFAFGGDSKDNWDDAWLMIIRLAP